MKQTHSLVSSIDLKSIKTKIANEATFMDNCNVILIMLVEYITCKPIKCFTYMQKNKRKKVLKPTERNKLSNTTTDLLRFCSPSNDARSGRLRQSD